MGGKGALMGVLAVFLVIIVVLGILIGSNFGLYKEEYQYYEEYSDIDIGNIENIVTQNNIESNSSGSLLFKSSDGFYFTINNKKVVLPMQYSTFVNNVYLEGLSDTNKTLKPNESKQLSIKIGNDELLVTITNFDNKDTQTYSSCFISQIEAKPSASLKIKGSASDTVSDNQLVKLYGESDAGNTSLDEKYFYYKTTKSMMGKALGVEFVIDVVTGKVLYFDYGINMPNYVD